jgi:hypothetical protein
MPSKRITELLSDYLDYDFQRKKQKTKSSIVNEPEVEDGEIIDDEPKLDNEQGSNEVRTGLDFVQSKFPKNEEQGSNEVKTETNFASENNDELEDGEINLNNNHQKSINDNYQKSYVDFDSYHLHNKKKINNHYNKYKNIYEINNCEKFGESYDLLHVINKIKSSTKTPQLPQKFLDWLSDRINYNEKYSPLWFFHNGINSENCHKFNRAKKMFIKAKLWIDILVADGYCQNII